MNFDEMSEAVSRAETTINLTDRFVGNMLKMCVGRLRKADVWGSTLTALKKELRDWDMHRGEWIERNK